VRLAELCDRGIRAKFSSPNRLLLLLGKLPHRSGKLITLVPKQNILFVLIAAAIVNFGQVAAQNRYASREVLLDCVVIALPESQE
jgi:hypothetical protein